MRRARLVPAVRAITDFMRPFVPPIAPPFAPNRFAAVVSFALDASVRALLNRAKGSVLFIDE